MKLKKLNNSLLISKYESIYQEGAYKNFFSFDKNSIQNSLLKSISNWNKLDVLDFGCGEGDLSNMISKKKAKLVHSVDYSSKAIKIAKKRFGGQKNILFELADATKVKRKYDVIVMSGVLEHIDDPFGLLRKMLKFNLKKNGMIVFLSPSFMNPRGYVWMTLQILLDVPMSLTDIHFFSPTDFTKFSKKYNCSLDFTTIAHDWGGGKKTIKDLSKRLVNALRDAKLNNKKVKPFLVWLEDSIKYFNHNNNSGALMVCKLKKK